MDCVGYGKVIDGTRPNRQRPLNPRVLVYDIPVGLADAMVVENMIPPTSALPGYLPRAIGRRSTLVQMVGGETINWVVKPVDVGVREAQGGMVALCWVRKVQVKGGRKAFALSLVGKTVQPTATAANLCIKLSTRWSVYDHLVELGGRSVDLFSRIKN